MTARANAVTPDRAPYRRRRTRTRYANRLQLPEPIIGRQSIRDEEEFVEFLRSIYAMLGVDIPEEPLPEG